MRCPKSVGSVDTSRAVRAVVLLFGSLGLSGCMLPDPADWYESVIGLFGGEEEGPAPPAAGAKAPSSGLAEVAERPPAASSRKDIGQRMEGLATLPQEESGRVENLRAAPSAGVPLYYHLRTTEASAVLTEHSTKSFIPADAGE